MLFGHHTDFLAKEAGVLIMRGGEDKPLDTTWLERSSLTNNNTLACFLATLQEQVATLLLEFHTADEVEASLARRFKALESKS